MFASWIERISRPTARLSRPAGSSGRIGASGGMRARWIGMGGTGSLGEGVFAWMPFVFFAGGREKYIIYWTRRQRQPALLASMCG